MTIDYDRITRKFLMGEGREHINPHAILQSIKETLSNIKPSSRTDQNRIELAKSHINEVINAFRRLEEQVATLKQQAEVVEESSMAGGSVAGAATVLKDKKDVK